MEGSRIAWTQKGFKGKCWLDVANSMIHAVGFNDGGNISLIVHIEPRLGNAMRACTEWYMSRRESRLRIEVL
jgi:hypothetical protein